jgi:hypothetical protein
MNGLRIGLLFLAALTCGALAQTTMQPGTNTPLIGCVEGRALRIVNGFPACSPVAKPTLSSCGTNPTLSANATDFVGRITWTGLANSCVLTLSKDYGTTIGCLVQSNSSLSLATTPTIASTGSPAKTTVTIPVSVSLSSGQVMYICAPV